MNPLPHLLHSFLPTLTLTSNRIICWQDNPTSLLGDGSRHLLSQEVLPTFYLKSLTTSLREKLKNGQQKINAYGQAMPQYFFKNTLKEGGGWELPSDTMLFTLNILMINIAV